MHLVRIETISFSCVDFDDLDCLTTNNLNTNPWTHELLSHNETNSFFESVKLASSGEINWHDVDVKPYCGNFSKARIHHSFEYRFFL